MEQPIRVLNFSVGSGANATLKFVYDIGSQFDPTVEKVKKEKATRQNKTSFLAWEKRLQKFSDEFYCC